MQNACLARRAVTRASLATGLMAAAAAHAAITIHVPQDAATIQGGIDRAANGDTVLVAPGTYLENIDFKGKAITVASAQGPEVTIIDGQRLHSVVRFQTKETRASVLDGFTLQHGEGGNDWPAEGGGVVVIDGSPIIRNNIVQANSACDGNGIGTYFASPLITNNRIIDNVNLACSGGTLGGGIYIGGNSNAVVTNNQILRNRTDMEGGGIGMNAAGTPYIAGNVIQGNATSSYGGGVGTINDSEPTFVNNLVQGNTAPNGAGIFVFGAGGGTYASNTIVDNVATGHGTQLWTGGTSPTVKFANNILRGKGGKAAVWCDTSSGANHPRFATNDIWTSAGRPIGGACSGQVGRHGNIAVDPLFVGGGTGPAAYQLQPGSPLVDAGIAANASGVTDLAGAPRVADGNGDGTAVIDVGALEYQPQ